MGFFNHYDDAAALPAVVLVHGAFADSTSWADVNLGLTKDGFPVVAVANPLRDPAGDADYLASILDTIEGRVVLVGHSYAGAVIIPVASESSGDLNTKLPSSLLTPDNLVEPATAGGRTDLYIQADKFGHLHGGGLSSEDTAIAAAAQSPITAEAPGGVLTAAPTSLAPKVQAVATKDHAVPTALQRVMAERAGATAIETDSDHDAPAAWPRVVLQAITMIASPAAERS